MNHHIRIYSKFSRIIGFTLIIILIIFTGKIVSPKTKRKYGYKISESSKITESEYYSMSSWSKFEESMENSKSILTRYSGDRLSAPVQLLESIIARDIGRFINISSFLSRIGYKFGKSKHSETALTAACKISGEIGYFFVSHLLSLGASVDLYSEYGFTPLLLACKNQHKEVVRLLIEKGKAHLDCTDSDGRTPLFYAISQLDIGLVNYLLEKGANPNFRDILGNTPLIHALMVNFKEAVSALLSFGAFPWIRNYAGFDPVTLAVLENRIDILPILISSKRYSLEEFDIRKNIPEYHHSAARRLLLGIKYYIREQILLELLEIEISLENVVICSSTDQNGLTILWWACKLHYPKLIFRLLEFYIQARKLPEGHICNPHKTGNNQIMPIELLISRLYSEEQPYGFSFRRRFMDLMFKGTSLMSKNTPNIVLMNIFVLLFMVDPHSNRSFLIQALYSDRSIETLTKVMFGVPMYKPNSNFQSVTQMMILIKKSEIMKRFSEMIKANIFTLINSNLVSQGNNEKDQLEQSVLLLTSKIISMVFKRDVKLKTENLEELSRNKILNPFLYPLLVIGETNSLEESNSLSISILRGNNLLTIFFTNLFNQCIEQTTTNSLSKYKHLCTKAYHGALKLALKQHQPTDSNSIYQKGVDLALFTLLKNRPKAFNDILVELDYCKQSEEAIAVKLLQYVISVFLPKLSYSNKKLFNSKLKMESRKHTPKSQTTVKHRISDLNNKYPNDQFKRSIYDESFPLPFPSHTYETRINNISPLEFSTKSLLNYTCDVSTPRFVDLLLFSTWDSMDLLSNGIVMENHLSKTMDFLLRSRMPRSAKLPQPLSLFVLQNLGFSPSILKFVLRKHQISEDTKPFYNFVVKRSVISEAIISHPSFKSSQSIDNKIVAIIIITLASAIMILLTVLIVSDTPSSYKKRYIRNNMDRANTDNSIKSFDDSVDGSLIGYQQYKTTNPLYNSSKGDKSSSSLNSLLEENKNSLKRKKCQNFHANDNSNVHSTINTSNSCKSERVNSNNRNFFRHNDISDAEQSNVQNRNSIMKRKELFILAPFKFILNWILSKYVLFMIGLSSFLSTRKQISPTFLLANNLPIKSKSYLRALIFGLKCTLVGYDAFEDIFFRIRRLFNCKDTEIQRKTNTFIFFGLIRLVILFISMYWIILCKSIDLMIVSVYLSLLSAISNASLSLATISIRERDRLFHLFVPSSVDLLSLLSPDNEFQGEGLELNETNSENMISFSSSLNANQDSSNVSPMYNEKIVHILDKYSDSLLTPASRLIHSHMNNSPLQSNSPMNQFNEIEPSQNIIELINEKFWYKKLPSHKYWTLKDVFYEYYSIWMCTKHSGLLQSQNIAQSNNLNMIYDIDLVSSSNSPNSNTMFSQNPFEAMNSCMTLSDEHFLFNVNNGGIASNSNLCASMGISNKNNSNNSVSQITNSNNSPISYQNNVSPGEYSPILSNFPSQIQSFHLQNSRIERHILAICQAEFIRPNDCRIWYIIQWLICMLITLSFYTLSYIDKKNLYFNFLRYPEKWIRFSESTIITVFFEVILASHFALLVWSFLNPLGFLWVLIIQRFRIFLYIINNLLKRRKKRKLTNINETLILRELTFFITIWNYVISRNNGFLQLTLYNKYFKSAYFFFLVFFALHFFIVKGQIQLIFRSQLFFTLFTFVISLLALISLILIIILLTNLITKSISSSINSILHTYYHNKLFHLFLRREVAILSAKRHDAFLHFDYY
ncbi:Ank repeat protein with possible signal peptide [Cryptosporidium parvum Iowa II]|uniref:Ank repeat protein with possible signal peptide n=1 Tax=Cryptosporidium parvum (strain Iowa II) TaxID=353152 RepID=Q5CQP4_CRYPI|nr:Ank repeat protein with possible signal peptide [Cryptosporidium parvum Iowa II]EAK87747.1 Ank repeat protein with possible signal peptide [Cryptosporidium parvum Iowa II]